MLFRRRGRPRAELVRRLQNTNVNFRDNLDRRPRLERDVYQTNADVVAIPL